MGRLKWVVIVPVALVALGVAGSFVYVNFIAGDAPERLSVDGEDAGGDSAIDADISGTWTIGEGSQAGYRVPEILFGQETTAVGRTDDVEGAMTIDGRTVTDGNFTVHLETVTSDESRRDNQFRGRIMDVANHPTARFELSEPIELGELPAAGQTKTFEAKGKLTLRGTTNDVVIPLEAKRTAAGIEVAGRYEVIFDDWQIPNPSFGPAQVGDKGELEFLLVLTKS
ncbi:MAG TPA: YceI family protein [Acidimicrobiales bacterium]|jgi:polyisoprenoid-binding protein YceI|nr:YceI family protein [Acidimicrobiales bacterium]